MKKRAAIHLILAVTIITFTPSPAFAGKFSAVVNGRSYHINSSYQWNEDNYGFGVEHEFAQVHGER